MDEEIKVSDYRGHQQQFRYANDIRNLAREMRAFPELGEECNMLERAVEGIVQPFSLAVFGRMKTGKSSILNAFLGRPLTITGVNEATATINHISYASDSRLQQFRVHWKDAEPEMLPISELKKHWNGTDDSVLRVCRRTDYLELYADVPKLKSVNIIDTPGTGSTAQVHEDIAQQFIGGQETDALIYVCSFEVRDTDLQDLRTFSNTCLSSPSPYNCLALLHKWDLTYWNNGGNMSEIKAKALKVHEQIGNFVTSVLPVSAPLAYVAKRANPDFWTEVLGVLESFTDEENLCRQLRRVEKWNRDSRQAGLYSSAKHLFDMPWDSFRVMLRHLYRLSEKKVGSFAAAVLELSGFSELEKRLDNQFFMNRALIKHRQVRARVKRALDNLYNKVETWLQNQASDISRINELNETVTDGALRKWLEMKRDEWTQRYSSLDRAWVRWDYRRREISDDADLLDKGIVARRWLAAQQSLFSSAQCDAFNRIIDIALGIDDEEIDAQTLQEMAQTAALYLQSPREDVRFFASMLRTSVFKVVELMYNK